MTKIIQRQVKGGDDYKIFKYKHKNEMTKTMIFKG